jgi:hypothetical protein
MTHPDTDVLAEFRAGLITGRRGARITAHLAGCDRCTALDDQLAGVSVLLASVPAPAMPDSVTHRLDAALAAEVARRDSPERARGDGAGESPAPRRPRENRGFRLLALRVLAPAAAVVLLAAGGYGLIRAGLGSGTSSTASSAEGGATAAASTKSVPRQGNAPAAEPALSPGASARSQVKSPNQAVTVSPGTLRQYVQAELSKPRAARPTKPASSRVLGCVHNLAGNAPLELVQSAQFEGQPATIIVARTGQGYTAWVAGPACTATSADVLDRITLPSGISGP